jgi:ribosomal protein L10
MNAENKTVTEKPIPEEKVSLVSEIAEKIKSHRTVLVASCYAHVGEPGRQACGGSP